VPRHVGRRRRRRHRPTEERVRLTIMTPPNNIRPPPIER
jgi:hypothetical protein